MGIERSLDLAEDRRFPGLTELLEVERGRLEGGLGLGDGLDRGRGAVAAAFAGGGSGELGAWAG